MSSKPKRPEPKCRVCSEPIPYLGTGRPAIFCERHAPTANAKRRRQVHSSHAGNEPGPSPAERRVAEGLRIAEPDFVALELRAGRSEAEALVASGVADDRRVDVLALAKGRLGTYEGSREVIAGLSEDVAIRALLELRARLPMMPIGQLPTVIGQLAKALELFSGGIQPTFGTIVFEIPDPNQPIASREEVAAMKSNRAN